MSSRWSIDLAILVLLFLSAPPLAAAADPITGSTVRIIEGNTAPGWELRFLPPPPPALLEPPDTAILSDVDRIVPPPPERPAAPVVRPWLKRRISPGVAKPALSERPPETPADAPDKGTDAAKKPTAPVTPPPNFTPPAPKIDKEEETEDDSADKRKKERRDLLREKRKERNYHNRRVE